jgi:curved DNA-binding protein
MPHPERSLDHTMEITVPFATAVLGGEHRITMDRGGKSESITARIPQGIESGKKIRLRNLGHSDPSGRQGDLLLKVQVAPHPFYRRNGLHLSVMLPVTISEALLGTKVDLPTPHGRVTLTVPAGSSSGRVLRMKGMGIKTDKGSGDLLVELEIVVPEKLTDEQRETIRAALAKVEVGNPRLDLTW